MICFCYILVKLHSKLIKSCKCALSSGTKHYFEDKFALTSARKIKIFYSGVSFPRVWKNPYIPVNRWNKSKALYVARWHGKFKTFLLKFFPATTQLCRESGNSTIAPTLKENDLVRSEKFRSTGRRAHSDVHMSSEKKWFSIHSVLPRGGVPNKNRILFFNFTARPE